MFLHSISSGQWLNSTLQWRFMKQAMHLETFYGEYKPHAYSKWLLTENKCSLFFYFLLARLSHCIAHRVLDDHVRQAASLKCDSLRKSTISCLFSLSLHRHFQAKWKALYCGLALQKSYERNLAFRKVLLGFICRFVQCRSEGSLLMRISCRVTTSDSSSVLMNIHLRPGCLCGINIFSGRNEMKSMTPLNIV